MQVRPEVRLFAEAMERRLQANDHKPGWKHDSPFSLLHRVGEELEELHQTIEQGQLVNDPKDAPNVLDEAADVANFLMMVSDVLGYLT